MRRIAETPVTVHSPPIPEHIRERTAAAGALGLSRSQTSHSRALPRATQLKRFKRLRTVVRACAEEIQGAYQRTNHRCATIMITTTYAPGQTWEPKDVSKFLQCIRDYLARRNVKLRGAWVMELQKRGAPHHHILLWLPHGMRLPKPDVRGWWKKGSTRIEWAKKPVRYITKYASKGCVPRASMPAGARIYGVMGCPRNLSWWRSPPWMQAIAEQGMRIYRRKGGWWCVWELSHAWRSPWVLDALEPEHVWISWVGWQEKDIQPLWLLERDL